MRIASISPTRINNYSAIRKNNNKGGAAIKDRPANDTISFGKFAENKVCQASPELMMQVGLLTNYGYIWPFKHRKNEADTKNYETLRDIEFIELYCKKDSRRVNARFDREALKEYMKEHKYSKKAANYVFRVVKDYENNYSDTDISTPYGASNICEYLESYIKVAEERIKEDFALLPTEEREAIRQEEQDERDYYIATHGLF